jgi:hypothetical protein
MNLSAALSSVDLTTLDRIRDGLDYGVAVDAGPDGDAYIERLITDTSRRMTEYLGFHTLSAARTETYELPVPKNTLTLSGRPVDLGQTFEIRIGTSTVDSELDALTAEDAENYRVSSPGGWVRLLRTTAWYDSSLMRYARVTYTSGLGATASAVVSSYPDISQAAELQIRYQLQRRDSLGGDINVAGGGAVSMTRSQFGLLKDVREILDGWRRHRV